MATIQATAQAILKQAGWRMESKLARGKQCWAKTGYPKKVYIGTHGSIRVGRNLVSSLSITVGALKNVVFESRQPDHKYVAGMFHYSNYWRTWSFVLHVDGYNVTEMNLTPINPQIASNWSEVGEIRNHCTALDKLDVISNKLPTEVLHRMYDQLGVFETDELLTEARLLVF